MLHVLLSQWLGKRNAVVQAAQLRRCQARPLLDKAHNTTRARTRKLREFSPHTRARCLGLADDTMQFTARVVGLDCAVEPYQKFRVFLPQVVQLIFLRRRREAAERLDAVLTHLLDCLRCLVRHSQ